MDNVRSGCEAQAKGTNVRMRCAPVEGTMKVYELKDYGARQAGSDRPAE